MFQLTLATKLPTGHVWHNQGVAAFMGEGRTQVTDHATQTGGTTIFVQVALHDEPGCQFWAPASHCSPC